MKTSLFCFLVILFAFGGCNKIKEAATVKVPAILIKNISVSVPSTVGLKSFDLVAVGGSFSFGKTDSLVLEDDAAIEPLITRLKAIDLNSVSVTITGLSGTQEIYNLSLEVKGLSEPVFTKNLITVADNTFQPTPTQATLNLIEEKLRQDKKIILTVKGTASANPMGFNVELTIGADVIVYVIP